MAYYLNKKIVWYSYSSFSVQDCRWIKCWLKGLEGHAADRETWPRLSLVGKVARWKRLQQTPRQPPIGRPGIKTEPTPQTPDNNRHQTTTDIRQQQTPDNNRYHTAGSGSERSHNFDKTPRSHLCCPTLQLFETQLLSRETTPQISENGKANLTENGPAANILVF